MADDLDWWRQPRRISVVVDNPSWVLEYATRLVSERQAAGDDAVLCRNHAQIKHGAVAFYLGCIYITPPDVLARNSRNLVVHASDLPRGRGFSPLTWMVLEERNDIPVCLIEAVEAVDAGPVLGRASIDLEGHELIDEIRTALGAATLQLCHEFLDSDIPPDGVPQEGVPTTYARRRPADSRLDPERSIEAQFNLLRVVDNERYPAFFDHRGHRYQIVVRKMGRTPAADPGSTPKQRP